MGLEASALGGSTFGFTAGAAGDGAAGCGAVGFLFGSVGLDTADVTFLTDALSASLGVFDTPFGSFGLNGFVSFSTVIESVLPSAFFLSLSALIVPTLNLA